MFGGEYFCIQLCGVFIRGDYDVQLTSGAMASEMKLVPHVSRVCLDTLHVLGWVIFVYVLDVNYVLVYLCAWWLVAIGEPYTCAKKYKNDIFFVSKYKQKSQTFMLLLCFFKKIIFSKVKLNANCIQFVLLFIFFIIIIQWELILLLSMKLISRRIQKIIIQITMFFSY